MKVILTAFGGKLMSEVMEWPEEVRQHREIKMIMDLDKKISFETEESFATFESIRKVGRFVSTGQHIFIGDEGGEPAEEYKLVEVS